MWLILLVMVVIVVLAGLVIAYAAYPSRGQRMPALPWLGSAMEKAVDAAPTLGPATRLQRHRGEDELPLFQERRKVGARHDSAR